jgi:hypothetical protein
MGDDIVEMAVWGQGAEAGCTGCMSHVVEVSSATRAGDLPPFRIKDNELLFHNHPPPSDP